MNEDSDSNIDPEEGASKSAPKSAAVLESAALTSSTVLQTTCETSSGSKKPCSTYLEAVPEETMAMQSPPIFHIPESNASDFAPSECSSYYRKGKKSL